MCARNGFTRLPACALLLRSAQVICSNVGNPSIEETSCGPLRMRGSLLRCSSLRVSQTRMLWLVHAVCRPSLQQQGPEDWNAMVTELVVACTGLFAYLRDQYPPDLPEYDPV